MRLDTANRSFAGLLAAGLLAGMFIFCGAVGCVLVVLVVSRIAADGFGGLSNEGGDLWPALVFIAIVGAGAVTGVLSLWRQIRASRRLETRVRALDLPPTEALTAAAERAGVGGRVRLLDCDERFSFAYGAITPRVVVSRGLYEAASPEELDAVLEHERYHVRNLDPLKVLLARAVPATFFYAPVLSRLQARYVARASLPPIGAPSSDAAASRWPERCSRSSVDRVGLSCGRPRRSAGPTCSTCASRSSRAAASRRWPS
jgi:Zn-dependent protease with chaperone function